MSQTIGIIGGGQLGRMLSMAAARLGFKVILLDPDPDCPARQLANRQIVADYNDRSSLAELGRYADVVTYEFENVPVDAAQFLNQSVQVFPPPHALEIAQDRLVEKQFFNQCAIATAPFWQIDNDADLRDSLEASGGKGILKTRCLGYDGKGQLRLDETSDPSTALATLHYAPAILEGFVDFALEISVLAARSPSGAVEFFDIPENSHEDGILRRSRVPARIDAATIQTAQEHVGRLLKALDYVGIIGVEFFVLADGSLIANEFAPRVHNSGHWTEVACCVSQFDQHIRAIAGLPLAPPLRHSDCVMENLIGDDVNRLDDFLPQGSIFIHLYGKQQIRKGRKMGHFTRLIS